MTRLLACALCLCTVTCAFAGTNASPARLGIIVEGAAAATAADLLTAELSKREDLQLLERSEIERVYREQALSLQNKDYLKLGQVLGADGLLLLQPGKDGTNQCMSVRLIAVKPGVILEALRSDWPVTDLSQWTVWLVRHFEPLFPKLGVLARDALPISVVNLRSSVQSQEQQELERRLTTLTIERLTRERDLFVLERRRMDALGEEKQLAGTSDSAFWNGSYLLEGVLDRDGYNKDTMTLNARLVPKSGPPVDLALSGPRRNPAGLVEQLTKKILEALHRQITAVEWNPAEEAQKYYEEAGWALKWGLYREAQAAAESAWALGKQDLDCALVRVRAYMPEAWRNIDPYCRVSHTFETVKDESDFLERLTNKYAGRLLFEQTGHTVDYAIITNIPSALAFARVLQVLELYVQELPRLNSADGGTRRDWCDVGASILTVTGEWLRDFYLMPAARRGQEQRLAEARQMAAQIAGRLRKIEESDTDNYWDAIGGWGVFWCETPNDGILLYRDLFQAREFHRVRQHAMGASSRGALHHRLELPLLTDWGNDKPSNLNQIWQRFLREIIESDDREFKANGYFLTCAEARNIQEFMPAYERMEGLLYGEARMNSDIDTLLWQGSEWYLPSASEYQKLRMQRAKSVPFKSIEKWTPARARKFAAELQWISNTIPIQGKADAGEPRSRFVPSATNILPAVSPRDTKLIPTNSLSRPPGYWTFKLITNATPRFSLHPTYWKLPLLETMRTTNELNGRIESFSAVPSIVSWCYREGHLWLETDLRWAERRQRFFIRLDLDSFLWDVFAMEVENLPPGQWHDDPFAPTYRTFDVCSNFIFTCSKNRVQRYEPSRKTWEDLAIPIDGLARITAIEGRLFVTTSNSILEASLDGRTSRILASTRRKPPVTILDGLDDFNTRRIRSGQSMAPVFPGPEKSIISLVSGSLYQLSDASTDWRSFGTPSGITCAESYVFEEGTLLFIVHDANACSELYFIRSGSTNIELLLNGPSQGLPKYEASLRRGARWQMQAANLPACPDRDSLWVFRGQIGRGPVTLLHFTTNTEPAAYDLAFGPVATNRFHSGVDFKGSLGLFEHTPKGLVMCRDLVSGIWYIPESELQAVKARGTANENLKGSSSSARSGMTSPP